MPGDSEINQAINAALFEFLEGKTIVGISRYHFIVLSIFTVSIILFKISFFPFLNIFSLFFFLSQLRQCFLHQHFFQSFPILFLFLYQDVQRSLVF